MGERVGASKGCWEVLLGPRLGSGWMEAGRVGRSLVPLSRARPALFPLPSKVSASSPLSPIPHANLSPDGSRCHGLRWRRCRSPRSEPRSQESGGTDTASVSKKRGLGTWTSGAGGGRSVGPGSLKWGNGVGTQAPGSGVLIGGSVGGSEAWSLGSWRQSG